MYFANTGKEYKKKTEELTYNIKSDNNKEVYKELIQNIEGYITASKADLDKRYNEGLDDYSTYLDKQAKLYEGIEDTYDKLGLSNEKLAAVMEKNRLEQEKISNSLSEKIKEIIRVGELTGKTKGEIGKEIESAMKNTNEGRAKLIFDMEKADPWLKDYVKNIKLPEVSSVNQEKIVELETKQVELQQEKVKLTEQEISQLQKDKKSAEESVKEYDAQIVRLEKLFSGSSSGLRDKKSGERANEIERLYSLRELDGKRLDDINESLNSGFKTVTKNTEVLVSEAKSSNVQGKKDGNQPDLIAAGFQKYNSYLKSSYNSKTGIDFSQYDSIEKIKALYEETLKKIDIVKNRKDNAVNNSMLEALTKLSELLKPLLGIEALNTTDIHSTKISELESEKSRLKSELKAIEDKYSKYTDSRGLEGGKLAEPLAKRIVEIDESIIKLKEFGTVAAQVSESAGKTSIALGNVEEKVNDYIKAVEEQKQSVTDEKIKREDNRKMDLSETFEKGIEDLFLNINPQGLQESLISGVKDLFDKAVTGTDIGGVYRDKYNEAFGNAFREVMADFKPSGNYLKDQEEYQKRFIEALKELATSSDAAVRSIANLTLFDTVKNQLDELAGHLSTAGEVLKDDFLKNLATTVESLSALAESL
ncbi:hypothetical protein NK213_19855, partial [Sebaldella sp. S0638]|nr:hypothetical protein [Sebaldella sp. S0638]